MPRFGCRVTLFVATLTLTVATVALAQTDPAALAQQFLEAIDRGDTAGALALYADDAVKDGGGSCGVAPCIGRDAIQKEFARLVADKPPVHTILKSYVSGNVATIRFEARSDRVTKAGVERVIEWGIFETKGNKIVYARTGIFDRSDPQTARFTEWQRTQQSAR
jgi:hypothetical protein